jgi:membrane-associated phospholipid phosphatase
MITHLGGTWVVIGALAAASVADWLRRRNVEVFVFAAVVIVGEKLIINGMKWLVDRERPDVMWLVSWSGASFPSGHTAAAAAAWPAVALILGRGRSRRTRALLAAGAALISVAVAASRALLGVHWLTDVLAGLVIGWGWFLIVAIAFGGRAQRLGDPATARPRGVPMSTSAH